VLCKFCNQDRPLVKAHVVPEAFYRELKTGDMPLFLISSDAGKRPVRSQIGPYDTGILCRKCEDQFQDWDDYAATFLIKSRDTAFERVPVGEFDVFVASKFDYSKLKLFLVSVVWRAAVSTNPLFDKVRLGPRVDRAKELLNARTPGDPSEFAFVLSRLQSSRRDAPDPKFATMPFSRTYPGGCHAVKIYLGSFIADVCTGRQPFPDELGVVAAQPNEPLRVVGVRANEVRDFKLFKDSILAHGPRLFSKYRKE